MRGEGKYWLTLALVVLALMAYEVLRPRPLDWTPSLAPGDTRPYGAEVLHRLLPGLTQGPVRTAASPLRTLLEGSSAPQTLFVLADEAEISPFDAERLLAYAERGGTVLIAAHRLSSALDDTLGLNTWGGVVDALGNPFIEQLDTLDLQFLAPGLGGPLRVSEALAPARMRVAPEDTTRWTDEVYAAARLSREGDSLPAYTVLRLTRGEGVLVLTNAPLLLSNFALLNGEGQAFAERLFAYVPTGGLVWWRRGAGEASTPLRYVLQQPALRLALWAALAAVGLFMLRAARRRERPVPTVAPPRNDTVDFARTIGLLFYNRGDHANLAAKVRHQFYAHVRDALGITTVPGSADFAARVAQRAGVPLAEVEALLALLDASERAPTVTQQQLLALGRAANHFYRASTRTHPVSA